MRTEDEEGSRSLACRSGEAGWYVKETSYLPYAYVIGKTDDLTQLSGFQEGALSFRISAPCLQ